MNHLKRIFKSKWFIIGISLIIIYTICGFFLVPYLLRHYVPEIVHEKIDKKAAIGEVRFNPYIFKLEVNDFRINEPNVRKILGFERLLLDFELKSLFKWAWTFKELTIEEPQVNVVISPDGALNLTQLVPPQEKPPVQDSEKQADQDNKKSMPRLSIEQISIGQGQIDLVDERQSIPAAIKFTPLNLNVENLSTLPEKEGQKAITLTTEAGGVLRWAGDISINPVATKGTVVIENIKIGNIWKFFRDSLDLEMPDGVLNISADYNIRLADDGNQAILSNLKVALSEMNLKLTGADKPFLELPQARISNAKIDFFKQQVRIEKAMIGGGRIGLVAGENGVFNLERIIRVDDTVNSETSTSKKDAGETWEIELTAFGMEKFGFDYQDMSHEHGVTADIGDIGVDLKLKILADALQTELSVSGLAIKVSDIAAKLPDVPEPAVKIDQFRVEDGDYDLADNHFTAQKISINGGKVDFIKKDDGVINLLLLARAPEREPSAEKNEEADKEKSAFGFMVDTVAVNDLEADFSDFSAKTDGQIMNIDDISLVFNNIDGKSPTNFNAELKVRQGGQISATGSIDPSMPSAQSDIWVKDLELKTFQPYIGQVAMLVLQSGVFTTKGTLQYGTRQQEARTVYKGGFGIDNLRFTEPGGTETFLGWKNVRTENLTLNLEPNHLEIGQLDVAEIAGKFIIYEDETINIVKVIKIDPDTEPEFEAETKDRDRDNAYFPIKIRRINLKDGEVEFADLSLRSKFGTSIHKLGGTVVNISTERDAVAEINLDGLVDEYGTAKVEGGLKVSNPTAFSDINVIFRNLEMTKLTPYSGKFAGREIESGKLSLDLEYKIEESRLVGDNQIVVEQLVLGERVESPEALNLPLNLAIALLEDSKGVIDIGLPVRGDLDSPEFSFGGLIWKALANLLNKIVTSPFRALASLIPGGEDETLNIIAFEAGLFRVPPPEKEKLAKLTEALKKRPRLKLTVTGRYNPETDKAALRKLNLRRSLAVRMGQETETGKDPGLVNFGNPETVKALEEMFVESFGPDAYSSFKEELDVDEEAKEEDTDAVRKLEEKDSAHFAKMLFERLKDAETVGEADLLQLAEKRARSIVEELSRPDGISAERIQVKTPAAVEKTNQQTALLSLEPIQ
ncbi:MAG: DUF748 domain-containing protein [Desulfobacterales bacterium]